MLRRVLLLLGVLGLIGIGSWLIKNPREPARNPADNAPGPAPIAGTVDAVKPAPQLEEKTAANNTAAPSAPPPSTRRSGPVRIRVGQEIPEIFPHQAERDAIQALVSKYDPHRVPEIASYLSHPDATVRDAARLGLIQLGYNEAIPYLKSALAKASATEAEQLQADIEFLSLPSAEIH